MILRVIGSTELVEQVFWLDCRTRTCGVKLRHPVTKYERASEVAIANLEFESTSGKVTRSTARVEDALGARAQVILQDE